MARTEEKNLDLGSQGLLIETEQDPASSNMKALTNAPIGSLKHAVNVDYQGGRNLRRRMGYEDLWHDAEAKTVEITLNGGVPMTNEPTTGDVLEDDATGAQIRVLSADLPTFTIIGITLDALLFVIGNGVFTAASASGLPSTLTPVPPGAPDVSAVDYAIAQYDVQCQFQAVGGEFCDSVQTWGDTRTLTHGIRGLARYTYVDNRQVKSNADYDLERYTIFATRDDLNAPFDRTHTYHFRNRGTPGIKRLEMPVLDRDVFPDEFSDANYDSMEATRFWNYIMWSRGIDVETYLLGTYGGHYTVPSAVALPPAWNCGLLGTQPPALGDPGYARGTFDQPVVNAGAFQRRVLIWFPTWYEWWSTQQAYTVVPEVGLNNWFAPFILYFDVAAGGESDFYAEPCGRFIERYKDSLFMARIERTELVNNGTADDTLRWVYEPSGIMWSFWGYATGMELGTPPVYPFDIPFEPNERVWGCAAEGFRLNRHTSFTGGDGLAIVGLKEWNERLYVMKPNGFMEISGNFSGDFNFRNMGMSQGPCGPFAWAKADMGIFYVTKKGLYLFDGNKASENICLSTSDRGGPDLSKIFREDIDWNNSINFQTGEVLTVSMVWDKINSQLIISYPKRGEQGGGGVNDLPRGTPTRMLVYDTTMGRFTEWDYPMPNRAGVTYNPAPGIMLSGRDPTDDDKILVSHPVGNTMGVRITCNTPPNPMIAVPTIGATITQAATGATMTVTGSDLPNLYIYGDDLNTGFWDLTPISDGGGGTLNPDPCTPSAVDINNDGRLLYIANEGYRDNVEIDGDGDPDPDSGDRITYDVTTQDLPFGQLKPKLTVTSQRQVIYANSGGGAAIGGIKRRRIFNYYNEVEEEEITFGATEDGYYSEKRLINNIVTTGTDSSLAITCLKYYHDESDHSDAANTNVDGPIQFIAVSVEVAGLSGDAKTSD